MNFLRAHQRGAAVPVPEPVTVSTIEFRLREDGWPDEDAPKRRKTANYIHFMRHLVKAELVNEGRHQARLAADGSGA